MQQQEIVNFLEKYFVANHCDILERQTGHMTVQLTIDLDKQLMNRPFYWTYVEKTGGEPNPMKLTLITDRDQTPDNVKGDFIHFGAPRLHQIFESTKKLASYIRLYQHTQPGIQGNTPLYPWLGLNIKVSYKCDRKRDILMSLGLQLINGIIIEDFQEKLEKLSLTPKIPDLTYTMSPLVKPQSGVNRLQQYVRGFVETQDHAWADEARKRWKEDLALLDSFYEGIEEKPESYDIEKAALKEQYEPKVLVEIINGGLFYLCQNAV
ncbi:YqhG family protein [Bacillus timonensis]|uniref:YqhG family protein n=1 Tax=Bacillus timonensis TaxID=1033734 RepID=UPI000289C844|nr:YqhG family protein [Bacillus timonensis]